MAHIKFQEYLNRKGVLKTSGTVKTIADFEGEVDSKPPKEKKHKDAGGKGQDGEIKPYHAGGVAKDPNKGKNTDGFAEKGDKKLKYEPNTDVPKKVGEGGKKTATWPKTESQEWLEKTRGMSLAEFTKTVRDEALNGLDKCDCKDPVTAVKEAVNVCKCNERYISALVREMKRNGLFGKFFTESLVHPEAFSVLAGLMEQDESYSRRLVRAMNEMVAPPMGEEEDELAPEDELGGLGGEEDELGMEDDLDGLGDEDELDLDGEGEMEDDLDAPMPPHDKIGKIAPPKKKKKHAADHLLGAMKDTPSMHGPMKNAMMMGMR